MNYHLWNYLMIRKLANELKLRIHPCVFKWNYKILLLSNHEYVNTFQIQPWNFESVQFESLNVTHVFLSWFFCYLPRDFHPKKSVKGWEREEGKQTFHSFSKKPFHVRSVLFMKSSWIKNCYFEIMQSRRYDTFFIVFIYFPFWPSKFNMCWLYNYDKI